MAGRIERKVDPSILMFDTTATADIISRGAQNFIAAWQNSQRLRLARQRVDATIQMQQVELELQERQIRIQEQWGKKRMMLADQELRQATMDVDEKEREMKWLNAGGRKEVLEAWSDVTRKGNSTKKIDDGITRLEQLAEQSGTKFAIDHFNKANEQLEQIFVEISRPDGTKEVVPYSRARGMAIEGNKDAQEALASKTGIHYSDSKNYLEFLQVEHAGRTAEAGTQLVKQELKEAKVKSRVGEATANLELMRIDSITPKTELQQERFALTGEYEMGARFMAAEDNFEMAKFLRKAQSAVFEIEEVDEIIRQDKELQKEITRIEEPIMGVHPRKLRNERTLNKVIEKKASEWTRAIKDAGLDKATEEQKLEDVASIFRALQKTKPGFWKPIQVGVLGIDIDQMATRGKLSPDAIDWLIRMREIHSELVGSKEGSSDYIKALSEQNIHINEPEWLPESARKPRERSRKMRELEERKARARAIITTANKMMPQRPQRISEIRHVRTAPEGVQQAPLSPESEEAIPGIIP